MITDLRAKSAKPGEKSYRIGDGGGLYLRVDPTGRKYWILRYWEQGREHQMSLGPYPDLSIREARDRRDEIQKARALGQSPRRKTQDAATVETAAHEWMRARVDHLSEKYRKNVRLRLEKYILPALGPLKLEAVTSGDVLRMCRRIEAQGHEDTAHRVKVLTGQIFRFAIAAGYVENDPSAPIGGALKAHAEKHFPTITDPERIGALYRAMQSYPYPVMRAALLFSILTFARPGEVRAAEWREIKSDTWDLPEEKMKMRRRHLVPLSRQAVEVLTELKQLTGGGRWLFPSPRNDGRCMSENGVRVALRSIGFPKEEIVPHGFRAMASTILNEHGFNRDVIERQLAHVEGNSVRRAYNHAEYLPERRKLMQWWADWLEALV